MDRSGSRSASVLAGTGCAYLIVLAVGLLTLPSAAQPVQEPWFTLLELLVLGIAPALVVFVAALLARVSSEGRGLATAAQAFLTLCAGLTSVVHFCILTLGRSPRFREQGWAARVFTFEWPSLAYALDILAWDLFFPIGAWLAACALPRGGPTASVRRLLALAALLALLGLAGIPLESMAVRDIGILGYAVLLPIAAALMVPVFRAEEKERGA